MLLHDLRLAVRSLAGRPAFAAAAIVLLGLGAGANAAVFSVVRGVLLRPLPFDRPDALVAIWPDESVSNQELGFWRERARTLDGITAIAPGWLMALVAEGGEPLKITGARVADNFFAVLGAEAAIGRTLEPGDGSLGRERVAVIADGLWRQRFGGDRGVIGRSVLIDQVAYEVVGVMPPGFEVLGQRTELWVPLPFAPGTPAHRTTFSLALGRLRAGVTSGAASRELASLVPEMRRTLGRPDDWGRTLHAASLQDTTTQAVRPALTLLLAAVGLVLLLGAANLGTLVLGRSIERARELAVRTAIGASRRQLVRQLLVEQIVLAAAGALAGLALAAGAAAAPGGTAAARSAAPGRDRLDGGVFARRADGVGRAGGCDGPAARPGRVAGRRPAAAAAAPRHRDAGPPARAGRPGSRADGAGAGARRRRRADAAIDVEPAARRSGLRSRRRPRLPRPDHVEVPLARGRPAIPAAGRRAPGGPAGGDRGGRDRAPADEPLLVVDRRASPGSAAGAGREPATGGLALRLGRVLRGDAHSAAGRAALHQRRSHRRAAGGGDQPSDGRGVVRRSGGGARPAAGAARRRPRRRVGPRGGRGGRRRPARRARHPAAPRDVHAARADLHVPDAHGGAHGRRCRVAGGAGARRALRRRSGGAGGRPAAAADR